MPSKCLRIKRNSDNATRVKLVEKMYVFIKATWDWFHTDAATYNNAILQIFEEMTEVCNGGDAQCKERYRLLGLNPATSNKNLTATSNYIHTTRGGISEKFEEYNDRLTKLRQSLQIEKTMFLKHVPPTDTETIKNMTNQELKTTLEQLSARNGVIQNWKNTLQEIVDDGNHRLIPEFREAYQGCISFMEDISKKSRICK
ncbi:unnamed protein product [Orchesella dallaii]|uniref:Uncharacterized protein n=1 Tax=Orchesella dallaii TaxID=48710 RepID=A0ABP1PZ91_9HEXA